MELKERIIASIVKRRIKQEKSIAICGARQVGKTTLVRNQLFSQNSFVYYSIDLPDVREYLIEYGLREFSKHKDKIIILDEIQKLPQLMEVVKVSIDRNPTKRGQFILTGSSHILLLKNIRETLAGRIHLMELYPFCFKELAYKRLSHKFLISDIINAITQNRDLSKILDNHILSYDEITSLIEQRDEMLKWGGFPEILYRDEESRKIWFQDYRQTYLERDLTDLGKVQDLNNFARCHKLSAFRNSFMLNYSDMAKDLQLAVNTVKQYLRYLEISFQIFLLPPYFSNEKKQIIKTPKLYFTDIGLLRSYLQNFVTTDGKIYETFIISEVYKIKKYILPECELFYFRTKTGMEIDLVLKINNTLIPIEIKYRTTITPKDYKNIKKFFNIFQQNPSIGFVIYPGKVLKEIEKNIWQIPDIMFLI